MYCYVGICLARCILYKQITCKFKIRTCYCFLELLWLYLNNINKEVLGSFEKNFKIYLILERIKNLHTLIVKNIKYRED